MSNVKWIKLSTQMFEDEKIKLIEHMPDADTILIIWVKLLSQAGKANANGYIYLSENIPYTEEMLATIFGRPLNTVRMALGIFKQFGMIDIDDNHFINIENWEKHQNVAGLDKIREQTRKRVAKHREGQKLELPIRNVTLPVTPSNATELELELELDLELEKEKEILSDSPNQDDAPLPYSEIISYLNTKCITRFRDTTDKTRTLIKARMKEKFTLDDFMKVIDNKSAEWLADEKMNKFLRPETLFGTKFESYLNEKCVRSETPTTNHPDGLDW
ncbi:phage replisome organizer N-terminal domain-containing protein [Sporosarcina sp. FSL K6-1508]|uniref:phage replisome organizer N-terminal domain-containing protein n=1 Tax=Sporosarcina sp. FSL K6-1508 TaxID=2921553 RepID=UPI0030FA4881